MVSALTNRIEFDKNWTRIIKHMVDTLHSMLGKLKGTTCRQLDQYWLETAAI